MSCVTVLVWFSSSYCPFMFSVNRPPSTHSGPGYDAAGGAAGFSRFFRPLVLRGRPLADRFDLRLVDEPTLRTFFPVVEAADSSSRFCAASNSAQSGLDGILPMRPLSVSSL